MHRVRTLGATVPYNLIQAGKAVGKNKTTILRAIQRGTISAQRDEVTGGWSIDPAELHRVMPPVLPATARTQPKATAEAAELQELRARFSDARQQIDDLQHRLNESEAERRQTADRLVAAQERIAALLTDRRTAPSSIRWWRPWRPR